MAKKIAWSFLCPICQSAAFSKGQLWQGKLVVRCENNLCGHVMGFRIESTHHRELADPRYCLHCQQMSLITLTHKSYQPYSLTSYRKFMQCTNSDCSRRDVLLVTFDSTISPSAFGSYDPASGLTLLTKTPEFHAANYTHLGSIEDTHASGSGLSLAEPAQSSSQERVVCVDDRVSRGDQLALRLCRLDSSAA